MQDPGNVGTIVRLAAAFDAGGVALLPGCADRVRPESDPRLGRRDPHRAGRDDDARRAARRRAGRSFAADASGEPIDPPSRGAVLVFGSEGSGVSAEILGAHAADRHSDVGRASSR